MDRVFEAWFNSRHRVLGRWLHPFCLYDILALEFVGSPFLNLEAAERVTWPDVQLAVRICSARPGAALDPEFFQTSALREICEAFRYRRYKTIADPEAAFRAEAEKFCAYIADYFSTPKWCEGEALPEKLSWLVVSAARMLRSSSLSEAEVWSMPIGKLTHYGAAFALLDGHGDDLISPEEEAAIAAMQAMTPEQEAALLGASSSNSDFQLPTSDCE